MQTHLRLRRNVMELGSSNIVIAMLLDLAKVQRCLAVLQNIIFRFFIYRVNKNTYLSFQIMVNAGCFANGGLGAGNSNVVAAVFVIYKVKRYNYLSHPDKGLCSGV